jgi:protein-histidine pros-kinase
MENMDKSRDPGLGTGPAAELTQNSGELRHSVSILKAMVEICPLAVVAVDGKGIVQIWSRGAEEMFGWTEDQALGKPLRIDSGALELVLPTDTGKTVELTCLRSDGESLHVSASVGPLRTEEETMAGKIIILADLTSRRESEQERLELVEREQAARAQAKAERRFRELLEAAPDAILEIDAEGRIVLLNEVAEKMFGYTRV